MPYTPGQQQPGYQTNGFDPSVLPQGSNPDALTIDQVNIAMRNSPVWNSWMQQHGHDPANVHLSGSDKNGLAKTLELAGFPLPEGWEIDNSGNIREETHVGRNILIAAAIAGAAFGGYAVLAAYGSGAAAGGGGAAAAGSLGGVEAGATAGLGAAAAGGTLGSAAAANAFLAAEGAGLLSASGAAATAASVAAEGGAFTADGTFVGASTVTGEVGAGGVATTGAAGTGASTLSRITQGAQAARGIGGAIGSATEAAANDRQTQEHAGLTANGQNIAGQSAFESQMLAREHAEQQERQQNLKDVYRNSIARNPNRSPFNPTAGPHYSDQYLSTLGSIGEQGAARLSSAPTYSTDKMPAVKPYTPINPADVQGATGSRPSTLENVGRWTGPALSTYAQLAQIYGWGS